MDRDTLKTKKQTKPDKYLRSTVTMVDGMGEKGAKFRPFRHDLAVNQFCSWVYRAAMLNARADRMAAHQRQNAFNESRSQMIQNARQSNAAARDARQQSRTGGARFGTNQSPYRPPRFDPPPPPRRQFFVDQYGRINFFLP